MRPPRTTETSDARAIEPPMFVSSWLRLVVRSFLATTVRIPMKVPAAPAPTITINTTTGAAV
jgi:hypothetical protein